MNTISKCEPYRFFLHWLLLMLGFFCGLSYGTIAGLGIATIITGAFNVIFSIVELGIITKLHCFPRPHPTPVAKPSKLAAAQFIGTLFIFTVGLLLALLDPLMSTMFTTPIILGSLMIIGTLCSLLLAITGSIAAFRKAICWKNDNSSKN